MDTLKSFMAGWQYGYKHCIELTAREIANQFPLENADVFSQGNIDGIAGDRFRLNLLKFGPRHAISRAS